MKRAGIIAVALLLLAGCSSHQPDPIASLKSSVSNLIASNMSAADVAAQSGASGPVDSNPSAATAKSWMAKWCDTKPGMTRQQLRAIMGPPTQEFDLDSGTPQMSWYAYEFGFSAFMNSDDIVRQLDINDVDLTAAEKSQIQCDTTRTLD